MTIRGAIFDMDGTLTDSMFVWKDIGIRYIRSLGLTPPENLSEIIQNMSMQQVSDYFAETFGFKKTSQQITDDINAMVEPLYRTQVYAKAGITQLLAELRARDVKMCVATATDMHLVEMVLEKNGIREYFSDIFTCTSVGAGKTRPVIYERSLESLGTKKCETLVFEDALYAIKTAKAAGFTVAGIYDSFSDDDQEKIRALSDFYVYDYSSDSGQFFQK